MKDKPNRVTTVLKVVVTGEFYDDDATEETLRYAVEQDLEDTGFDVDVSLLKEQEAVSPRYTPRDIYSYECGICREPFDRTAKYCPGCGRPVKWDD